MSQFDPKFLYNEVGASYPSHCFAVSQCIKFPSEYWRCLISNIIINIIIEMYIDIFIKIGIKPYLYRNIIIYKYNYRNIIRTLLNNLYNINYSEVTQKLLKTLSQNLFVGGLKEAFIYLNILLSNCESDACLRKA